MNFEKGGQEVIKRMLEAYGFATRQALCNQLGVSKSTMATRFMRDIFPSDWVIQCVLDTKANIEWLVSGKGVMFDFATSDVEKVPKSKIIDGVLVPANFVLMDKVDFINNLKSPMLIIEKQNSYLVEQQESPVSDGLWLIDIDGKMSVKKIQQLPGHRVRVSSEDLTFDCGMEDLKIVAKVDCVISKL